MSIYIMSKVKIFWLKPSENKKKDRLPNKIE
jgi:hypothetical protein